jgi:hypothetical protein
MKVVDNVLPEDVFLPIQDGLMSNSFPWFYNNQTVYDTISEKHDYQLTHNFYTLNEQFGNGIYSSFFEKIEPIIKELNCFCLLRVKANLRNIYDGPQNKQSIYYHKDYEVDCTTAIFYMTTNNGYTIFKDTGEKVDCVANRLVIFDSNLEHAGISSNDSKQRIVINFNYIEKT